MKAIGVQFNLNFSMLAHTCESESNKPEFF